MYKGKITFWSFRDWLGVIGLSVFCVFSFLFSCSSVVAVSKPSTLSIDVQSSSLGITLYPSNGGFFAESSNATILVGTDNFTGDSLYTDLINGRTNVSSDLKLYPSFSAYFFASSDALCPEGSFLTYPWIARSSFEYLSSSRIIPVDFRYIFLSWPPLK